LKNSFFLAYLELKIYMSALTARMLVGLQANDPFVFSDFDRQKLLPEFTHFKQDFVFFVQKSEAAQAVLFAVPEVLMDFDFDNVVELKFDSF